LENKRVPKIKIKKKMFAKTSLFDGLTFYNSF